MTKRVLHRGASSLAWPALVVCLFVDAQAVRGHDAKPSKACALLPTADLEALYNAKAGAPWRTWDQPLSAGCTIQIANHDAEIQNEAPSAPASQETINKTLSFLRQMNAMGKQTFETKDFGDVGCYRTRTVVSPDSAPASWQNVCFLVTAGKLTLGLGSDASKPLDFEVVRGLLLKAAARRAVK
jgi:hypothetical protein